MSKPTETKACAASIVYTLANSNSKKSKFPHHWIINCKSYFNKIQKPLCNIQPNSQYLHPPTNHIKGPFPKKEFLDFSKPPPPTPTKKKMKRKFFSLPEEKCLFCRVPSITKLNEICNHSETKSYKSPHQ